ncbi:hypothetical protein [Pseudomonas mosselii]|uniref:hypothetical protein n=1 Tax=Pseudomonas mosselii TaxID=78327 RepID=UPI0021DA7F5D|nr:hypothetical protein [Pseudomonas mosselii]MCU9529365.1 hypothetical protein [Pseudomonas mosselii]MCU9536656.1 hypothetical protein [Pseudomonas mosselii]MCU9542276.1 hypothetical protein [Pseudomonas mosselii]MCU9548381.1 hypothetical protein [Pseudomonas mosselii]
MRLILYFAWQFLALWCAIKIGFALQVIDSVKIPVKDASVCELIGQAFENGACRMVGRAVGNLDSTWTITSHTSNAVTLSHITPGFMMYDPSLWHMQGGTIGVSVLIIATILLMLVPLIWLAPQLKLGQHLRRLASK